MTNNGSSLLLNRLLIIKNNFAVYDEKFGLGVNIIRGSNSTGKTTISDAIFYALGGDLTQMKAEFELCDFVIAEVFINDSPLVLKREIDPSSKRPMFIHWGAYDPPEQNYSWEKYSYSRSENSESFSQILFRLFGFPEVKSISSKITMHQVLRLLYGDQKTNPRLIFRQEQFDSPILREALGNMLMGIYDNSIYELQIKLDQFESKLKSIIDSLKTIYSLMGKTGFSEDLPLSGERLKSLLHDQQRITEELEQYRDVPLDNSDGKKELDSLKKLISSTKIATAEIQEKIDTLKFDIEDSKIFLAELTNKNDALTGSILADQLLGPISFGFCPSCFSQLTPSGLKSCGLCKNDLSDNHRVLNLNKIKNEIEIQIKESNKVIDLKKSNLENFKKTLNEHTKQLKSLENSYRQLTNNTFSSTEVHYQGKLIELGQIGEKIETTLKFSALNEQLLAFQSERDHLNSDIQNIKLNITKLKNSSENREKIVHQKISETLAAYLKADLPREEHFINAQYANFEFGSNLIEVDNKSNFSESSEVYLKNAFLLALLHISCTLEFVRFPRFLLLDGLDQGGIEDARVQNLQKLIFSVSNSLNCTHQIIFTTARIEPQLEKDAYTVGDRYNKANKTLRFKKA